MANGERGPEKVFPAAVYVRLLPEQREFVDSVGNGNMSEGIRRCIDLARNHPELLRDRPSGRPPRE